MWVISWILLLFGGYLPQSSSFPSALTNERISIHLSSYKEEVLQWLDSENISWQLGKLPSCYENQNTEFVELIKSSIILHLIPTPANLLEALPPDFNKRLTDWSSIQDYGYSKIIHVHQDIWVKKQDIVKSRLLVQSGTGNPKRIFARKTNASRINATYALSFLEDHHLWGAIRAKYYYGLSTFSQDEEELVAVATFSPRRKVQRNGKIYKSHELLRYCSKRETSVVGGISKLCKHFIRDVQPDDIVTVVDRDWGEGCGWHSLGFETVAVMDPLIMMVNPNERGLRRHLIGAGISNDSNTTNVQRMGLSMETLVKLDSISESKHAFDVLAQDNFFPVYDSGVERLLKVVNRQEEDNISTIQLWKESQPKYATSYYSKNRGISSLLQLLAPPLDSLAHADTLASWRSASGSAASAKLVFSKSSSMDLDATVEVREKQGGWRTVGIVGGKKNPSIYHGFYRVDRNGVAQPTAVVSEFIKTMAVLSLARLNLSNEDKPLRFLHFGYGAGTLVRLLAHHVRNSQHVAVELDSGVVDANNDLLPSLPNISLRVGDALKYNDAEPFDCICIDVFDENLKVPSGFYSTDFYAKLSDNLLAPTGIVVQNFHSGGKKRQLVLDQAAAAASGVFLDSCWVDSLDSKPNGGNKILLASTSSFQEDGDGNIVPNLARKALVIQDKFGLAFDAYARVQRAKRMI